MGLNTLQEVLRNRLWTNNFDVWAMSLDVEGLAVGEQSNHVVINQAFLF